MFPAQPVGPNLFFSGADVKDIKCVINYDFPGTLEDYVHRIGRTGRAGATGMAYTFFTHADARYARRLVKILREAGQIVNPALLALSSGTPAGSRENFRSQGRPFGNARMRSGSNAIPIGPKRF